jgi:hypothetical protein
MMTITQTIDIPASRKITLTVPETVPTGRVSLRVLFQIPEQRAAKPRRPARKNAAPKLAYTPQPFPTLEELKEEAHRKTLEREASGRDPWAEVYGSMPDAFGDAVQYQRELRDEWPD